VVDYPDDYMLCALNIIPGNPLLEFAPLKHLDIEELLKDVSCLTHHEQFRVWLPS
jgi:hypothetical protein